MHSNCITKHKQHGGHYTSTFIFVYNCTRLECFRPKRQNGCPENIQHNKEIIILLSPKYNNLNLKPALTLYILARGYI